MRLTLIVAFMVAAWGGVSPCEAQVRSREMGRTVKSEQGALRVVAQTQADAEPIVALEFHDRYFVTTMTFRLTRERVTELAVLSDSLLADSSTAARGEQLAIPGPMFSDGPGQFGFFRALDGKRERFVWYARDGVSEIGLWLTRRETTGLLVTIAAAADSAEAMAARPR